MHFSWNLLQSSILVAPTLPKQRRISNQNRICIYIYILYPIPVRISYYMGVSLNGGTPKSSILIGFSIINHPFWGFHLYFWKHPYSFVKNPAYFILYFYTVPSLCRINQNPPVAPNGVGQGLLKGPRKNESPGIITATRLDIPMEKHLGIS